MIIFPDASAPSADGAPEERKQRVSSSRTRARSECCWRNAGRSRLQGRRLAARLAEGLRKAETERFDCALLDVNLDGWPSFPIAKVLARRGIPFVSLRVTAPRASIRPSPPILFLPSLSCRRN